MRNNRSNNRNNRNNNANQFASNRPGQPKFLGKVELEATKPSKPMAAVRRLTEEQARLQLQAAEVHVVHADIAAKGYKLQSAKLKPFKGSKPQVGCFYNQNGFLLEPNLTVVPSPDNGRPVLLVTLDGLDRPFYNIDTTLGREGLADKLGRVVGWQPTDGYPQWTEAALDLMLDAAYGWLTAEQIEADIVGLWAADPDRFTVEKSRFEREPNRPRYVRLEVLAEFGERHQVEAHMFAESSSGLGRMVVVLQKEGPMPFAIEIANPAAYGQWVQAVSSHFAPAAEPQSTAPAVVEAPKPAVPVQPAQPKASKAKGKVKG